ncbi:MAG TPA: hypothetical protein VMT12_07450 [Syntrophales bacterium]|nr:hypothetical protein [Syntrophales bacterium]
MNPNMTDKDATKEGQEISFEISLQAVSSTLKVTGGREIPFGRAILSIRNAGDKAITGFVPHATLAQEGGSVQDLTGALSRVKTVESLPPGETFKWDMYDLLLAEHPGVASKVHLWGYKAILNWWFFLTVWVEYSSPNIATPVNAAASRWKFSWNPAKPPSEGVGLSIEAVSD